VVLDGWLEARPADMRVVVVSGEGREDWARLCATIQKNGRLAVAEVWSRAMAIEAVDAGFENLVLKGQEAGGWVGESSAFILLQAALAAVGDRCKLWVRGGIGPKTGAGCLAAGASGVVLDGALLLAKESPLDPTVRRKIAAWDGAETTLIGPGDGLRFRGHLNREPRTGGTRAEPSVIDDRNIGWGDGATWPVGQDSSLAAGLARRFHTVGGIVQGVGEAIDRGLRSARAGRVLAEGSPLAESHGTRYPIVQGPMTRVSDRPEFAGAVADAGALPFLALALVRGRELTDLLAATREALAGRPWGVSLLGFGAADLRREQVAAVIAAAPPFALIAGGRPDQARDLEGAGIATYLHVPSPGLLRQFLRDGARRFVLEGRECGGHVGPRSSFVLWEQAGEALLEAIEGQGVVAEDVHLLYAGGVHDARSAAAVAAASASLAARGVRVGVLVGTAYLFTAEAVATGAVVADFQAEALRCSSTRLLETGPGHSVRVGASPFVAQFEAERRRLAAEGRDAESCRSALEAMNVGRLRVAAKGVERVGGPGSPLREVGPADRRERGLFMWGDVATLRDGLTTIDALHHEISAGATELIDRPISGDEPTRGRHRRRPRPSDVAIVGMAAVAPGAGDVRRFWGNTLNEFDAITEVPPDRWDWRLYYDADPKAPDKIVSRWGGFVPDVPFDPLAYGMPPSSLPSIEPLHLLLLEAVRAAVEDAGYKDRPFDRGRTAVVLGAGGGAAQLAMGYALRSYLPMLDSALPGVGTDLLARVGGLLPEWTEDSFPGILLNVAAGRVANRFDFGGANYTVDAACGSSLAAASQAVRELEGGAADVVVLGGADTVQNPFTYLAFSKTHAFSPRGRCRPFDAGADGIVISEGVAVVILKRLADAERDGDRVYSVIKGLGASSDGRAKGLTAPRYEGQVRALDRAYEKSGVSPATVGYVEAHGTGTAAGDLAEVGALKAVFGAAGAAAGACGLGSVKSLVGHTKCAAGLLGLINASLALHHRVLPPTIGVTTPNPKAGLPGSPFHLSTRARPWLRAEPGRPRRAGVSAFGFGGTNFHAVLEAYEGDAAPSAAARPDRPAELFLWRAADRPALLAALDRLGRALDAGPGPSFAGLAHALAVAASAAGSGGPSLALVASSPADLLAKLPRARGVVAGGAAEAVDPAGIAFDDRGARRGERLAFLFPGQGSQSPGMLGELALSFPGVLDAFEECDAALDARGRSAVGPLVFPPPATDPDELRRQRDALAAPEVAQPALGAASVGLLGLLRGLGLEADALAGHSYGELVALHAAGCFPAGALAELSEARGRLLLSAVGDEPGGMAALLAGPEVVAGLLAASPTAVVAANWNGPSQTVVSGPRADLARLLAEAEARGVRARPIPVACAYHSPLVARAAGPLADLAALLVERPPAVPVYSNIDAAPYPPGVTAGAVARRLGDHLASPVRFADEVAAMAGDGVGVFVEVGPGSVLTGLVDSILGDRPHLALACDPAGAGGVAGLLLTLGRLFVAGVRFDPVGLTAGRVADAPPAWDGDRLTPARPPLSPSTWLVNGTRARPIDGPEPARLGTAAASRPTEPAPVAPPPAAKPAPRPARRGDATAAVAVTNGFHGGTGDTPHGRIPRGHAGPSNPPPVSATPAGDSAVAVVVAYQATMQAFLEAQRATMLQFLQGGRASPTAPLAAAAPSAAEAVLLPTSAGVPAVPVVVNGSGATRTSPSRPVATAAPAARPGPDTHGVAATPAAVQARLLAIVRDRTGYPAEMLGLDLDLEADLGIDSIKRVEILGTLRESLPDGRAGSETELMDQLSRAKTLGAIVDRVGRHLSPATAPAESKVEPANPPAACAAADGAANPASSALRRRLLEAVDAPLRGRGAGLAPGGLVLITDDGRGVARGLADRLRRSGYRTLLARQSDRPDPHLEDEPGACAVDLRSPASVAALVDRARRCGLLAGVVHALPLGASGSAGLDPSAWSDRVRVGARGLFLLAKACEDDLAEASRRGGAGLIAATAMGGGFASVGRNSGAFFAGDGAVAGLVKTLAKEWTGVRARVIDFDPAEAAETLADRLVDELLADDRRDEAGYLDGRRVRLRTVDRPLGVKDGSGVWVRPGEPVVITGGARGITAAVAGDLAARWRPTLLLVGNSPHPGPDDPPDLAGRADPAEIKARLFDRLNRPGGPTPAGPAEVERAYQALRRGREIRANLARFRDLGAAAEYAAADVRDGDALGRVLSGWRDRHGPPVGLIHGAGVIHDKLLRDKTPEAFDRVLGTKLDGALNLARLADPSALRFAAFFSSVAGRFGNRGQADYAAANEALNKLALWLDRRWPCRVVSVLWGPWSGVGMVSDLEAHLGRQGLGLIPPEQGRSRLADELVAGEKGEVEVIVGGDLGELEATPEASTER